jgi:hypothetical protein
MISFASDSISDPVDLSGKVSDLKIGFTTSGWVFLTGMLLSYFIWIGMLLVWTQFPVACLMNVTNPTAATQVTHELELIEEPPLRVIHPQTEPEFASDRTKNPLLTPSPQTRAHTV